jgi:hypothetical protein
VIVDYTTLGEPTLKIRLEQEGNRYIVLNATDGNTVYLRADLMPCVRFMRAFALRENALVDERSVELHLELASARAIAWTRTRSGEGPEAGSVSSAAVEPASSPDLDLADVIPIRRHTA